jgi:hypothetical protein
MTLAEVNNMMAEITQRCGLTDYTYYQFADDSAPELPYMIFYYPSSNNDGADNVVWQKINRLNIELYTDNKEFSIENELETVLAEHGFFYEKSEQYIKDEKMYEVLYEMEVVINGQN